VQDFFVARRRKGALLPLSEIWHIGSMKTVTLSQAKSKLDALLRLVATGQEVEIVERRRPLARLVPVPSDKVDWNETFAKLDAIWGKEALPGTPGSQIVSQGRR
jgi:prevent-host-death family protein